MMLRIPRQMQINVLMKMMKNMQIVNSIMIFRKHILKIAISKKIHISYGLKKTRNIMAVSLLMS